jgi:rhamnogalacturonyl hydrolase YesR
MARDLEEAEELLQEWYDWWIETPGAPEKMPNSLHVRTALFLVSEVKSDSTTVD